jgi:AmmeMemoRadiSam system protein A
LAFRSLECCGSHRYLTGDQIGQCQMQLSVADKKELLRIARDAIESALKDTKQSEPGQHGEALNERCGAFVTLHIRGELRGCVGYIEARFPLSRTVREVAEKAAFEDPRFSPLTAEELEHVAIEISVLSPLRKIEDVKEIEVGKHGLVLDAGYTRGLLLPQVATEYDWNRDQFLSHTARKAGLQPDAWKQKGVAIFIFTSDVFSETTVLTNAQEG